MSITLHMVASLDGFVAKANGDYSWMNAAWSDYPDGEEMNADVLNSIECYIMGSRTYDLAQELGWPYGETRTIVVTSRQLTSSRDSVEFYRGDLVALADALKDQSVWLVGGPSLCQEFMSLELVHQICITIVPILLGDGLPFYRGVEHQLLLRDVAAFKNGMLDVWYEVRNRESGC